ncbi:Fic family protein [Paracoccus pantotrophus]|uniref:Fic family protein n=1 Tax=Paracoccus pantotrophus TaxID=82367 RepID=A0A7H9BQZ9_PARPN|nr:Fic family protein [Paracoccus pantotrophus]RNI17585.1 hypothetical protein EB844_10730 [Paracoccus pantotrophus]
MIPIPGHDASPYAVKGRIEPILASACGHHRLLWVHPFLDGNGRVAPLMSYAMLRQALEGRVAAREPFINGLDVDRGDVIGQQQDLIGVQFIAEFVLQLVGLDQARLQQARDEGAGAGEGGDDMDALGAEGLAELILQHVIDGADAEIDDLDGGVSNAQPVSGALEGHAEEVVAKLADQVLLGGGIGDALGLQPDRAVEFTEVAAFLLQMRAFQHIQHILNGAGDRVFRRESVVFRQGVENRTCDDVLGQHLDSFSLGDARIHIIADFGKETVEFRARRAGRRQDRFQPGDMGDGDVTQAGGPAVPVFAIAAFLDDLGHDGATEIVENETGKFGLAFVLDHEIIVAAVTTGTGDARAFGGRAKGQVLDRCRDRFQLLAADDLDAIRGAHVPEADPQHRDRLADQHLLCIRRPLDLGRIHDDAANEWWF